MKVPATVGVPLIVIALDAQLAETPAGNPFAPTTPSLEIPLAPVVACIMLVSTELIHSVGEEDTALTVLSGFTVNMNEYPALSQLPDSRTFSVPV